jgi:monoamine oxidase
MGKNLPDLVEYPAHGGASPSAQSSAARHHCGRTYGRLVAIWFIGITRVLSFIGRYHPLAMKFAAPDDLVQSCTRAVNHLDTMPRLSRRSFIAGSAAIAAAPALGAVPASGEVEVAIIGAGAAGIAAARRIAAAKVRFAVLEAADHSGGRCVTDTASFAAPFDRGAHWIHRPDSNALVQLAGATGLEIYPASRGQKLRVGPRRARDSELEEFLSALVRSHRAIVDAGRGKTDMPAAAALPGDLGDWRSSVEFALGPYSVGKELSAVSAVDFARAPERDADAFCRQGYGALLAKLAAGIPVQLSTPVTRLEWSSGLVAETAKGRIRARQVIVTVSTGVLAAGKIEFSPALPKRQIDAIGKLALGHYEHIALELAGNPFGLEPDDLVFEKSSGPRTAALLANIAGSTLCTVEVAGAFGRELARQGEPAMTAFALEWLASAFGRTVKNAVKRSQATRWSEDPFTLGAFSAAAPGADNARRIMLEPLRDRVWFAGEAVHDTLWGTVGGAWESGTRAAEAALRMIGALREPKEEPKRGRRRS